MTETRAEIRLPTAELRNDLPFYTKVLGMRLDMIYPADNPQVAVVSGHGLRLRIEKGAPETRRKLLAHALRVQVKQGHPDALALVGAHVGADLRATATVRPAQVRIGDKVQVEVVVHNPGAAPVEGLVDLVVHFVQKTGTGPKVFKGWKGTIGPGAEVRFRVSVSLAVHTTRAPRPGTHRVDLRVCGRTDPGPSFEVLPA